MIRDLHSSESTIRRDIEELVSKNLVIRSQGAVIWNDKSNLYKENVYFRTEQNLLTKTKITKIAAELIESREMIFIDTGTTMLELAKNLSEDCNLSVVTNDLKIALELENKYNVTTIMLGGIVKRGTHTTIENTGTEFLNNVCFQKAFFSPAGISDEGFYFLNLQAMDIRTKIAEKSEKMIMVADSAKFDKKATVLGFPFSECDILVTDTCSQEWKDKISPSTHIIIAQ